MNNNMNNVGYNIGNMGNYEGTNVGHSNVKDINTNNINTFGNNSNNVNAGVGKIRKTSQANQPNNKNRKIHNTSDSTSFHNDEAQYNTVNQQMTTGELLEERNLANCTFK